MRAPLSSIKPKSFEFSVFACTSSVRESNSDSLAGHSTIDRPSRDLPILERASDFPACNVISSSSMDLRKARAAEAAASYLISRSSGRIITAGLGRISGLQEFQNTVIFDRIPNVL